MSVWYPFHTHIYIFIPFLIHTHKLFTHLLEDSREFTIHAHELSQCLAEHRGELKQTQSVTGRSRIEYNNAELHALHEPRVDFLKIKANQYTDEARA